MGDIREKLAEVLQSVQRPGDFALSGRLETMAPRLVVEGVGEISLPLLPVQAEQLIAQAERAPYGLGEQTLVDIRVRRTWQIAPEHLRLAGRHWQATLERMVAQVTAGFGLNQPCAAQLYKLLVYDKGSFFVGHRDTEKAPGMFATLVVVLPSASSGGEIVVRHKEREVRLDLANEDPDELTFAAFYADCVHEVRPITSGYRVALVYNLVRQGEGTILPPDYDRQAEQIQGLLRPWCEGRLEGAPEKLVYLLEHAYTPAELGFPRLKGADAAVAALLASVAPETGCELHLALHSIKESGSAEHSYRGRGRHGGGEYEVVEVTEHTQMLSEWRHPDSRLVTVGSLPLEDDETSPPDVLEHLEPDEEEFEEATGNEGASFERTYSRAALVLWPKHRHLAVVNQAGPAVTLPLLESLDARWRGEGSGQDSSTWIEAHELAGHMLATWPDRGWHSVHGYPGGPPDSISVRRQRLGRFLAALTRLQDDALLRATLDRIAASKGHDEVSQSGILDALERFPPQEAMRRLESIVANQASSALAECCSLLLAAVGRPFAVQPGHLAAAARRLMAALPGDPARDPLDEWGRRRTIPVDAGLVADLVSVAEITDPALAALLADHLLAWPRIYDLDKLLIPGMTRLIEGGASRSGPAMAPLVAACLAHLQARASEPLQAPQDWSRAYEIKCRCKHCKDLSLFLAAPDKPTWTLRAAEPDRGHVEASIRQAHADVDVTTDRTGKPYGLVCTKNDASYQRRLLQRRRDLADIRMLTGVAGIQAD